MFDWKLVMLVVCAVSIGFTLGMFYANISYIRYKKTVDAITRHKGDAW
jgi:Na+/H+ antiporter NhaA